MTTENKSPWLPSSPEENTMLVIITSIFLVLASSVKGDQILDLLPRSIVSASHVTLKDLVSASSAMPPSWADREVFTSPEPGTKTEVPITTIAFALQKYPDMNDVTLRGQMQLTIERELQRISREQAEKLIMAYISQSEEFDSTASLDIDIDENIDMPAACDPESCSISGFRQLQEPFRYSFDISYTSASGTEESVSIESTVRPLRKAWVAKTALPRGHVLKAEDLSLQPVPADSSVQYLEEGDIFEGMELSRSLRPDEPVAKPNLLETVCAEKGDIINVRAAKGLLNITLKAKAVIPGRKGERITCLNEQSKKRITATLIGPREARLDI